MGRTFSARKNEEVYSGVKAGFRGVNKRRNFPSAEGKRKIKAVSTTKGRIAPLALIKTPHF